MQADIQTESVTDVLPILHRRKWETTMRMCVNFHKLKADTLPMNHAIPQAQEALDSSTGSIIFSTLRILSGFDQISITEEDGHQSAFRSTIK